MVSVRLEDKPAFVVEGQKVWISGQDNAQFAAFWQRSHENGLVDRLKGLARRDGAGQTGAAVVGVSRVEKDPQNRAFDFYIACEVDKDAPCPPDLERFEIPAARWAVFAHKDDLIACEMRAFMEWLPSAPYRHAPLPELEVYPTSGAYAVEFWLPVEAV